MGAGDGVKVYKISTIVDRLCDPTLFEFGVKVYKISTIVDRTDTII